VNVVKRRWPDLLIGLLVLLLLGGFAALLLGKGNGTTGAQATEPTTPAVTTPSTPSTPAPSQAAPSESTPATPPPAAATTPPADSTPPAAGTDAGIPTIEAAPVTGNGQAGTTATPPADATAPATTPQTSTPQTSTPQTSTPQTSTPQTTTQAPVPSAPGSVAPRSGGAVSVSEARTPTRNDYRVSLGKFNDNAAQSAATAGVSGLGYVVYPIPVVNGVVAQVGPFASREQATLALADIQRAYSGALLYPPRNAPARDPAPASPPTAPVAATPADTGPAATSPQAAPAAAAPAAPSGPVYLQVGAFNSSAAAQSAVERVRSLGLEPSVNAPAGKLVTVVVGPFQGRALVSAEAKLQAGGLDSFRVR
jgi:cell division septation protein DedD